MLHGIHKIFPTPNPNEQSDDKPNSLKKLQQGDGLWETKKEILGWIFDGTTQCINLPPDKVTSLLQTLKTMTQQRTTHMGDLEKVNGKLMHATIGIPNGCRLLSPIIATIATQPKTKHYKQRTIHLNQATKQALNDWRTLLPTALHHPTPCMDLITAPADYGGYCDASKAGAGGIWVGINRALPPLVWRVTFPPEIQAEVVSHANP